MPFENNNICVKLSLPTISLEGKETEDPWESLERKSLNWIWLSRSKRPKATRWREALIGYKRTKNWEKRTSNDDESIAIKGSEGWIRKGMVFSGRRKEKRLKKKSLGREQDEIKDNKKRGKNLSSEECYGALKFICSCDAGKIIIFILLIY